jgi:hypothetical protein
MMVFEPKNLLPKDNVKAFIQVIAFLTAENIPATKQVINPLYMVKVGEELIKAMAEGEKVRVRQWLTNQFSLVYEHDSNGEPRIRTYRGNNHFENNMLMYLAEQLIDRNQRDKWDSVLGEIIDGKDGQFI